MIGLVISLTITVISIILLLFFIWYLVGENAELKVENEQLVEANQILLAEKALQPKWTVGKKINKEPNGNSKNDT